jgi:hypothetical protein
MIQSHPMADPRPAIMGTDQKGLVPHLRHDRDHVFCHFAFRIGRMPII